VRNRWRAVAALLAALLATGCTATTGGKVVPAPNLAPRPLIGSTIKQVLLDGAALSKLTNQPFQTVPPYPPVFGGREKLRDRFSSAASADCAGVVYMLQKSAYQSADVRNVADEFWRPDGSSAEMSAVHEGVISLPKAADASALFTRFSEQWKQCDGKAVTEPSALFVRHTITDVRVMDSVLAATITLEPAPDSILAAVPQARAVGIAGNCLVEVEVAFFGITNPSDQGSADINTSGIKIAQALMDKVRALS
jgi:PknH-like extracellular domain